jgi:hypothetical protein
MTSLHSLARKTLYSLTTMKFRDRIKLSRLDFSTTPPILVFQMGKVGSTSICDTLESMNLGRPIYHVHYLSGEGIKAAELWHKQYQGKVPYSVTYFGLLGAKIRANLGKARYTIITGVREPIAKEISNYFELADKIDMGLRNDDGAFDADRIDEYLLDRFNRFAEEEDHFFTTKWFEQELKGTFRIDIYSYPFNKDKGYSIIREESLDLLVYQFEKMQDVFPDALGELLCLDNLPALEMRNVGMSKWYADLYADVKRNIVVPVEVCQKVYGTRYVGHFYSKEMIDKWIEHWSKGWNQPHNSTTYSD